MKAIAGTWNTLTDTVAVVGRCRGDSLYPLFSFLVMLLVTFAAVVPLLEGVLGSGWEAGWRWTFFFLVVYLAYGVLYLVIGCCNVALVMGIAARLDGDDPGSMVEIAGRTVQRLRLIALYTVVAATLGLVSVLARVLVNPLFGGVIAPRIGDRLWLRWHQLSYKIPLQLAIPIIALDQPAPENPFKRGERLVKATWGERVKPAHSVSLLALPVLIIVILYAIPALRQGIDERNVDLVWLGLSVMLVAISIYMHVDALVNAILALAAYRYATARKSDLFLGDASYGEHAFVKPKNEPDQGDALTPSLADSPPVTADEPAN